VNAQLEHLYRDLRRYAFSIAYRMLGSVAEAEDVVQDTFIRLSRARPQEIESPKAYVATVTTRLAIDALRSARAQREQYFGPWLPEPLVADDATPSPESEVEMADSLTMAFLVVLEKLSPVERAVFLLHDVFDYDYEEISRVVGKSEANCRQLATRARRHVDDAKPRFDSSPQERDALAERFFAACREGDMDGLVTLLADEVTFYGDGGGKGSGAPKPIHGAAKVAHFMLAIFSRGARLGGTAEPVIVNGQPGVKLLDADGALVAVLNLDVSGGAVTTVRSVINPDKLGHLGRLSPIGRVRSGDGPSESPNGE
jgi:RNA polymerase sigma-70 factor (ECF subfamily)